MLRFADARQVTQATKIIGRRGGRARTAAMIAASIRIEWTLDDIFVMYGPAGQFGALAAWVHANADGDFASVIDGASDLLLKLVRH